MREREVQRREREMQSVSGEREVSACYRAPHPEPPRTVARGRLFGCAQGRLREGPTQPWPQPRSFAQFTLSISEGLRMKNLFTPLPLTAYALHFPLTLLHFPFTVKR
jgi:hypothetical protein